MNHLEKIFLVIVLFFTQFAIAKKDTYNTYQWNRNNIQSKTNDVDTGDWYEWWYYKVVDPETNHAFFFVYGVINPWDTSNTLAGTRALVSAGDFTQKIYSENKFNVRDFHARYEKTEIQIAQNYATDKRIYGQFVDSENQNVSWDLSIQKDWSFNAMGWTIHAAGLSNIFWYPAQASAKMTGWIQFHNKKYFLKDAPAYQDRNWGRSFPKWWTWLVSNNFKNSPGTTLAAGGGYPKILNGQYLFQGLCIGFNHDGEEYAFRTTDGDYVKMDIRWGKWEVKAINKEGYKIEISAYAPPEKFLLLPFQTPRGSVFYDYEALTGKMSVRLSEFNVLKWQWEKIADLETDQAGIEWGSPNKVDFNSLFSSGITLQ